MPGAVVRWLGRQALPSDAAVGQRRSHMAATVLGGLLRLAGKEPGAHLIQTVTLVMCAARDPRVCATTRQALERKCADQRVFRTMLGAFTKAGNIGLRGGRCAPFSVAAPDFLFAPVAESTYVPRVRLVSHLATEPRWPAPPSTAHQDVAGCQIVLKAGYLPSEDTVAFLYLTGQWDRYDEADPRRITDARMVRRTCA
ncbi:hypothetical protein [Phytoactinopolyspora mesophila]|uniref:Uncharacterized protein n=1 Tax=Phytoactinopolyspora mesophila TaxID=2650750 RepID=A0A7K3M0H9_9ACTN|nr:hypothetical protein [Phytoactinopolyspora mesophila]NDL56537.1 hypothetical protein [Phytoactinopolyspora mesophila]